MCFCSIKAIWGVGTTTISRSEDVTGMSNVETQYGRQAVGVSDVQTQYGRQAVGMLLPADAYGGIVGLGAEFGVSARAAVSCSRTGCFLRAGQGDAWYCMCYWPYGLCIQFRIHIVSILPSSPAGTRLTVRCSFLGRVECVNLSCSCLCLGPPLFGPLGSRCC